MRAGARRRGAGWASSVVIRRRRRPARPAWRRGRERRSAARAVRRPAPVWQRVQRRAPGRGGKCVRCAPSSSAMHARSCRARPKHDRRRRPRRFRHRYRARAFVRRRLAFRRAKPAAMASVATVAMPKIADSTISTVLASGAPKHAGRHAQQRVARNTAQAGRQRPGADARQRGGEAGGEERGEDPQQAAPLLARPACAPTAASRAALPAAAARSTARPSSCIARSEKMAPGKPSRLRDRMLRGVAERGVLHRPGGERDGAEQSQRDQREAGDSRSSAGVRCRAKCSETKGD